MTSSRLTELAAVSESSSHRGQSLFHSSFHPRLLYRDHSCALGLEAVILEGVTAAAATVEPPPCLTVAPIQQRRESTFSKEDMTGLVCESRLRFTDLPWK